jgi:putative ABC transport system ATP-binding protein
VPPLLSLCDINKEFTVAGRRQRVLEQLNLNLNAHSSLAIKGDSGSGKSTLLHLIGGLDKPDSGEIWFDNNPIHSMGDAAISEIRRSRISYIFQDYQLIPTLSTRDNIRFQAVLSGRQDEVFTDQLIEQLDLTDSLDKLPPQLSGGQQQRVAIARALVHKPDLILADEPTGNLDNRNSARAIDLLLGAVKVAGSALIMVTHSDEMANALERVLTLEGGKLIDLSKEPIQPS